MMEITHFSLCLFMTGLIWLIQLVHYPSFAFIEENNFSQFENFHTQRISLIVMPAMIMELISGLYLLPDNASNPLFVTAIIILGVIWGSTFFFSVPCHFQLNSGKNNKIIKRLVLTNWLRTVGWSLRSGLLIYSYSQGGIS